MKKAEKFVAECGYYDNPIKVDNNYSSCGHGGSWSISPEELHKQKRKAEEYAEQYKKLIQKENRKIKQTYEYALKKILPECIKQLKSIKDKNVRQLVNELNNVDVNSSKPTIMPFKKAVNLAWRHNKEKLGDKFLKIMIAIEEYRDAIKHYKAI